MPSGSDEGPSRQGLGETSFRRLCASPSSSAKECLLVRVDAQLTLAESRPGRRSPPALALLKDEFPSPTTVSEIRSLLGRRAFPRAIFAGSQPLNVDSQTLPKTCVVICEVHGIPGQSFHLNEARMAELL